MRIRVCGGGWYGCSIALALIRDGHDVELHESAYRLFNGASGSNPARLHQGQHYPRSKLTRDACQKHHAEFMVRYGFLTRGVPVNLYAVAAVDSMVDFGTYCQVLRDEIEFITVDPAEFGLQNVEGAILTGERHIVIAQARAYFERELRAHVVYGSPVGHLDSKEFDVSIDATFCALDSANVDRYEPCLTVLLAHEDRLRPEKAVTIMDGPFPSLYPWDEDEGYSSLTSAALTPISKKCRTWQEAQTVLDESSTSDINARAFDMVSQMTRFYPDIRDYLIADKLLSIRAMPKSGSDARLVDVMRVGERAMRVRAGKIDAILDAERIVKEMLCSL